MKAVDATAAFPAASIALTCRRTGPEAEAASQSARYDPPEARSGVHSPPFIE